MSRYDDVLKTVLGFEGGYSNDPDDRGGETNLGITEGTYARAKKAGLVIGESVKDLTRYEAARIYHEFYWKPCKCDLLPAPVDLLMFDAAVNHGVGGAGKLLQEALNAMFPGNPLAVDGVVGPKTWETLLKLLETDRALMASSPDLEPHILLRYLCVDFLMNRTELFDALADKSPSQRKFLRGWIHQRVVKLAEKAGLA